MLFVLFLLPSCLGIHNFLANSLTIFLLSLCVENLGSYKNASSPVAILSNTSRSAPHSLTTCAPPRPLRHFHPSLPLGCLIFRKHPYPQQIWRLHLLSFTFIHHISPFITLSQMFEHLIQKNSHRTLLFVQMHFLVSRAATYTLFSFLNGIFFRIYLSPFRVS